MIDLPTKAEVCYTEQIKLSTLLANLPDPIFILDMNANIVDANPAAAHFMGYSKPELLLGKVKSTCISLRWQMKFWRKIRRF